MRAGEALPILFDLIEQEGLVLGGSSAINIVGAMRLARDLGPGKTIATILAEVVSGTSPSSSIRTSCARRTCRYRLG
jgi:cysteine synthase